MTLSSSAESVILTSAYFIHQKHFYRVDQQYWAGTWQNLVKLKKKFLLTHNVEQIEWCMQLSWCHCTIFLSDHPCKLVRNSTSHAWLYQMLVWELVSLDGSNLLQKCNNLKTTFSEYCWTWLRANHFLSHQFLSSLASVSLELRNEFILTHPDSHDSRPTFSSHKLWQILANFSFAPTRIYWLLFLLTKNQSKKFKSAFTEKCFRNNNPEFLFKTISWSILQPLLLDHCRLIVHLPRKNSSENYLQSVSGIKA